MVVNRRQQAILFYVLGAVGAAMILVAGFFLYKTFKLSGYNNVYYKFSLKYPPQWEMKEGVSGTVVMLYTPLNSSLDRFRENVSVVVQDLPRANISMQEYSSTAIHQIKAVFKQNINIETAEATTLSNRPAFKLIYVGKGPEAELKYLHIWVFANQKAYQLTYAALLPEYAQFEKDVEKVIQSFRIK